MLFIMPFLFINTSCPQSTPTYKIFQFPADKIPSIDGDTSDWDIVPEDYAIGIDQLRDDRPDSIRHKSIDKKNLDVKVKVGWVKGLDKLYILYQASDNYWDFFNRDLHNDIFELVVDGDRSGGPFITSFHPDKTMSKMDAWFSFQNTQAQNYHIFTPPLDKKWAMVWGPQSWLAELPWSNAAYKYNFKPGEPGRLTLECWITPFDYAGAEGPQRAVPSLLTENKIIGLCWAIIDYDDVDKQSPANNGFWNLSPIHTMYGDASALPPFRLMPLLDTFRQPVTAHWSFSTAGRSVHFQDRSEGNIDTWTWDFGDGAASNEQNPVHTYKNPGYFVVTLTVQGKKDKSRLTKVWEVAVK